MNLRSFAGDLLENEIIQYCYVFLSDGGEADPRKKSMAQLEGALKRVVDPLTLNKYSKYVHFLFVISLTLQYKTISSVRLLAMVKLKK